jgi:LPS sulfotransferase NodH
VAALSSPGDVAVVTAARLFEPRQLFQNAPKGGESAKPVEPDSLFAIIACQRSGTHLLRHILNSNAAIAVLGETFSHAQYFMCWHNFVGNLTSERYPPLDRIQAAALVDEYIHAIHRDVGLNSDSYGGPKRQLQWIGLDIKYEHIRCVGPLYSDLRSRPFLFDYFRDRRARIVHLVRRNIVHAAISISVANARKVWHNYDGSLLSGRFRVTPDEFFRIVHWISRRVLAIVARTAYADVLLRRPGGRSGTR